MARLSGAERRRRQNCCAMVHLKKPTTSPTDDKPAKSSAPLSYDEQLHQFAFEEAPFGILHVDPQGRIIKSNAMISQITGYPAAELLNMTVHELGHPDERENDSKLLRAFLNGETPVYKNERRYVHKDGFDRWVSVTARMVVDGQGRALHTVGIVSDISEQKAARQQLAESEAKVRLGVSIANIGLGAINYIEDTITLDTLSAALFQLPANRPIPRADVHARFHPDDTAAIATSLAQCIETMATGFMSIDHRIVRPDGSTIWVSARKQIEFVTSSALERGRPLSGLLAVLDITDRKHTEAALREREERLRLVLDASLAFTGVMNPDGTLVEVNTPALSAGGLTRQDVIGRKIWDCDWWSGDPLEVERLKDAVERAGNGKPVRYDATVRTKDNSTRTVDFMLAPVVNEHGAVELLVPSASDITERLNSENALRRSHDTYLNLIQNNPFGVYLVDSEFKLAQVSMGARKVFSTVDPLMGRDFETILKSIWPVPFANEATERFRHTLATGEPYSNVMIQDRNDIKATESYDWQIERVVLPNGEFGVVCYFYDMTERNAYEQQIKLLMSEVNHRAKNLLGVVQAIARQTVRTGNPATFEQRLSARIAALAYNQDLLVQSEWTGVEVSALARAQLAHFTDLIGSRILMTGPSARLTPAAAQGIGMALHELSTNAAKYGALSNGSGCVILQWEVAFESEPTFVMEWREEGGPSVEAPARHGFGKMVMGRMTEAAVNGNVTISYPTPGLVWKLAAPASNTLERMI
jgi:PAS domain S-box-containing protein